MNHGPLGQVDSLVLDPTNEGERLREKEPFQGEHRVPGTPELEIGTGVVGVENPLSDLTFVGDTVRLAVRTRPVPNVHGVRDAVCIAVEVSRGDGSGRPADGLDDEKQEDRGSLDLVASQHAWQSSSRRRDKREKPPLAGGRGGSSYIQ